MTSVLTDGVIAGGGGGSGGSGELPGAKGYGGVGGSGGVGINLQAGGSVTNTGSIAGGTGGAGGAGAYGDGAGGSGGVGVYLAGGGSLVNTGSIRGGVGGAGGGTAARGASANGVVLLAGGSVRNGVRTVPTADISGLIGVDAKSGGAVTVTNFGTIEGTGGTAVRFGSSADRLIAMTGSRLIGRAQGGAGTLELASGTGAVTGLGSGGSVSGPMSMAFTGFNDFQFDGGTWTLGGNAALGPGQVLDAHGAVNSASTTLKGSLTNDGVIEGTTSAGLILSSIAVANAGGTIMAVTGSKVTLSGATIIGGSLSSASGGRIVTGKGAASTLDGSNGPVAVSEPTRLTVSSTTHLTLKGAIVNSGRITLSTGAKAAVLTIDAAGVTLSGGGAVILGASAANTLSGPAGAVLTNVDDKIIGGGFLGAGTLTVVNQAEGLIEQTGAVALLMATGSRTIVNAGTIEAAGAGGMTIKSAVANNGLLEAVKGNLTVKGTVSGTGSAIVKAATLYFAGTFNQNVRFSGATGVLALAHSRSYAGSISGFSKLGKTQLDLLDIGFTAGATTASYAGTTAGGTLTVTDGTHTAHIQLTGDYTRSKFVTASDGHGGTLVHDPATSPSPDAFASAMAGMGQRPGTIVPGATSVAAATMTLARPGSG
jgi:hypothetical protein